MDEKITRLVETAIKIKKAFSHDEIRLEILDDFARAIIPVTKVDDLNSLYQMTNGLETRLTSNNDKIEICLYIN